MHVSPSLMRADGEVSAVFLNNSNTKLAPARVGLGLLAMCPFISSCCDVPSFATKREEISNTQAQDVEFEDSQLFIAVLPTCCPVGYHSKLVEGDIFETGFK